MIERLHRPSFEEFKTASLDPGKPVVLTGAMDDWPALAAWTRSYLTNRVGERRVVVRSAPAGDFSITPETGPRYVNEEMTFARLLAHLDAPPGVNQTERTYYLQGEVLEQKLPELLADIRVPVYVDQTRLTGCRLWFGPGQRVALHYDTGHNILALIRGVKRLTLFDPDQLPFLYHSPMEGPNSSYPYSRVDVERPDLGRFPQFARARSIEVELHAGEMLFLPAFWWHHVVSSGENVAVNFWWQLMPSSQLAALGRTFAAFQDVVGGLPKEWREHVKRLANDLVF
jgi:lysine-specific demethylase 8